MLRKIFDPKRDEVTGDLRQLHSEKLHDLYFSPNIIRVIKSNNVMDRARGTYGGQEKCIQGFWWGDLMERDYLEDLGVDGRLILNCILKKSIAKAWTGKRGVFL